MDTAPKLTPEEEVSRAAMRSFSLPSENTPGALGPETKAFIAEQASKGGDAVPLMALAFAESFAINFFDQANKAESAKSPELVASQTQEAMKAGAQRLALALQELDKHKTGYEDPVFMGAAWAAHYLAASELPQFAERLNEAAPKLLPHAMRAFSEALVSAPGLESPELSKAFDHLPGRIDYLRNPSRAHKPGNPIDEGLFIYARHGMQLEFERGLLAAGANKSTPMYTSEDRTEADLVERALPWKSACDLATAQKLGISHSSLNANAVVSDNLLSDGGNPLKLTTRGGLNTYYTHALAFAYAIHGTSARDSSEMALAQASIANIDHKRNDWLNAVASPQQLDQSLQQGTLTPESVLKRLELARIARKGTTSQPAVGRESEGDIHNPRGSHDRISNIPGVIPRNP